MKKWFKVFAFVGVFSAVISPAVAMEKFSEAEEVFAEVWDVVSKDVINAGCDKPTLRTSIAQEFSFLFLRNMAAVPDLTGVVFYDGVIGIRRYNIVPSISLLSTVSADEFRALLLHEFGHIVMQHSVTRIKYVTEKLGMPKSFVSLFNFMMKLNSLASNDPHYGMWIRGQEYDADMYACVMLQKMGYNPLMMADALEHITRGFSLLEKFDKTHPSTKDRVDLIKFMYPPKIEDVVEVGRRAIPIKK